MIISVRPIVELVRNSRRLGDPNVTLCVGLKKLTPEIPVVLKSDKLNDQLAAPTKWLVSVDDSKTTVALVHNGRPVQGVISEIQGGNEITYFTGDNHKSYKQQGTAQAQRLVVRRVADEKNFRPSNNGIIPLLNRTSDLAFLEGQSPWDAAEHAILDSAGAVVVNRDDGTLLDYSQKQLPVAVAGNLDSLVRLGFEPKIPLKFSIEKKDFANKKKFSEINSALKNRLIKLMILEPSENILAEQEAILRRVYLDDNCKLEFIFDHPNKNLINLELDLNHPDISMIEFVDLSNVIKEQQITRPIFDYDPDSNLAKQFKKSLEAFLDSDRSNGNYIGSYYKESSDQGSIPDALQEIYKQYFIPNGKLDFNLLASRFLDAIRIIDKLKIPEEQIPGSSIFVLKGIALIMLVEIGDFIELENRLKFSNATGLDFSTKCFNFDERNNQYQVRAPNDDSQDDFFKPYSDPVKMN